MGGFDLDGTLVLGSSVLAHVGRKLGQADLVAHLVAGYESYALTNSEVSDRAAELFTGMSRRDLQGLVKDLPMIRHISDVVDTLHSRGIRCVIATITFDFASEWCADEFGFDGYSGIRLEFDDDGLATGRVAQHFDEYDKAKYIEEAAREFGITTEEVFYVGDSRSDVPTFRRSGFSVALNATPAAAAAAGARVSSSSLRDVISIIPGLGSIPFS